MLISIVPLSMRAVVVVVATAGFPNEHTQLTTASNASSDRQRADFFMIPPGGHVIQRGEQFSRLTHSEPRKA
jgi:hypothetical protein